MGVTAGDVVVGLGGVETGADGLLEFQDSGGVCGREAGSKLFAGGGKVVEGGEGVADHGPEIERAWGLVQGPEGFSTVGIEFKELLSLRLREVCR
jgi:hypothetical protein